MRYYLSTDKRKRTLSDWPTMLVTFFVCLLCWVEGYFSSLGFPLTTDDSVLPFWENLFNRMDHIVLSYVIGFLFVLIVAFIIQRISDDEMLISERTRLVFLFFVLFMSANAGFPSLRL